MGQSVKVSWPEAPASGLSIFARLALRSLANGLTLSQPRPDSSGLRGADPEGTRRERSRGASFTTTDTVTSRSRLFFSPDKLTLPALPVLFTLSAVAKGVH